MLPFTRAMTFSVLMGATLLSSPLIARAADTAAAPAPLQADTAAEPRGTVDQRITDLHASLAITPGQEADWRGVAKAMRAHAAVMDKLLADKSNQDPAKLTAVEDLRVYERFARAHVEGLKQLTASFETLYKSMPAEQKKVADQVFQTFGHEARAAHG